MKTYHVVSSLLASFSSILSISSANALPATLEGVVWTLQLVGGIDARSLNADVKVQDARFSGSDGCNQIGVSFAYTSPKENGIRFDIGKSITTSMACIGLGDRVSRAFVPALEATRSFRLVQDRLEFLDSRKKVRLVYKRRSEKLTGVNWRSIGLNINDGVESSNRVGVVRLRFGYDGRAQVVSGCKTLFIPYRLASQGKVSFDVPSLGRGSQCNQQGDEGIVHRALVSALSRVSKWERVGGQLELRSGDGALEFHAMELRDDR